MVCSTIHDRIYPTSIAHSCFFQPVLYHIRRHMVIDESLLLEFLETIEGPILAVPTRRLARVNLKILQNLMDLVEARFIHLTHF